MIILSNIKTPMQNTEHHDFSEEVRDRHLNVFLSSFVLPLMNAVGDSHASRRVERRPNIVSSCNRTFRPTEGSCVCYHIVNWLLLCGADGFTRALSLIDIPSDVPSNAPSGVKAFLLLLIAFRFRRYLPFIPSIPLLWLNPDHSPDKRRHRCRSQAAVNTSHALL